MAAWLIAGQGPSTASAAIRAASAVSSLPSHVPGSLARAAVRVAAGQPAAAGSLSAASMALADGVLTDHDAQETDRRWLRDRVARDRDRHRCLAGPLGPSPDAPAAAAPKQAARPAAGAGAPQRPEIDPLLKELIEAARQRLDAQKDYYEAGRITIDRYIAASVNLERVELLAAKSDDERKAIRQRLVDLTRQIEAMEKAKRDVGRSTNADVAEAHQAHIQAEYDLKSGEKEDAEKAALLRRIADLERKVEQLQKERGAPGRP